MKYIARIKVVLNCTRNILPAQRNLHKELICQNLFWILSEQDSDTNISQWFVVLSETMFGRNIIPPIKTWHLSLNMFQWGTLNNVNLKYFASNSNYFRVSS